MFKDGSTQELIIELLDRSDGLSSIDEQILADELINRNNNLSVFSDETLISALEVRQNVDSLYNGSSYENTHIFIEQGELNTFSGKATVLVCR
jgi:hypothetical protein